MNSNSLKSNIKTLLSGTILSQIILVASTPILTRIYSSDEFGVLSVFVSVISILSVASSLRYNRAVPLPDNLSESKQVFFLGAGLVLLTSLLVFFTLSLFYFNDTLLLSMGSLKPFWYIIPIGMLMMGLIDILGYWVMKLDRYRHVSNAKIIQTLSIVTLQICLYQMGEVGLIYGHVIGLVLGTCVLLYFSFHKTEVVIPKIKEIKLLAYRYRDFPKYSTWEALANSAGNNLPTILFGIYFGVTPAAFYALTFKVLSLPMNMIGTSVGKAYFMKVTELYGSEKGRKLTLELFVTLCNICFPLAVIFYFIATDLFIIAFGEEWETAGIYASIMTPWLALIFISSPLSSIISVSENQRSGFIFQMVFLSSKLLSIVLSGYYLDSTSSVFFLSISSAILLVIFTFWILSLSFISYRETFKIFWFSLVNAILLSLPVGLIKVIFDGDNILLLSVSVINVIVIFIVFYFNFRKKRGLKKL